MLSVPVSEIGTCEDLARLQSAIPNSFGKINRNLESHMMSNEWVCHMNIFILVLDYIFE